MPRSRAPYVSIVLATLVAATLLTPAGASGSSRRQNGGASGSSGGKLTFNKPVAMESFSPARTGTGAVYSDGDSSDHEWSAEPVLQVDKQGTIYIAGTCCVVASSPVWHSLDNGKTFKEMETPGHFREWGIGAEGDLAVDDKGGVYFVDTYIPGMLTSKWSEQGETWDYTVPTGVTPGFNDRPWLAYSEKALYLYVNHVSHTNTYTSRDGGMTWEINPMLSWDGSSSGQPFFPAHIAADRKKGTLWVVGLNSDSNGNPILTSAVSTDEGQTYTEAVVAAPEREGFSPIFTGATSVDANGVGYTTWSTWDRTGCDVYYAASTNLGKSWSKPVKVNSDPGCATFPWLTADGDGGVALAWYQTPATSQASSGERALRDLTNTTAYGGIELLGPLQDEVPGDAPWYLHAALIPNATSAHPKVVDARVPTKTPVMQGPLMRELWDFLQLDIGPDGRVHIAYAVKWKDSAPQTWYVSTDGGPRLK